MQYMLWPEPEKRCLFVVGPESSGTRLVTRIFIRNGCYGDDGHSQRIDPIIDGRGDKWQQRAKKIRKESSGRIVVCRRSVPHATRLVDFKWAKNRIEKHLGREVFWVIVFRDWWATVRSAVRNGHKRTRGDAEREISRECSWIFRGLVGEPFYIVYSSVLFLAPEDSLLALQYFTGVEIDIPRTAEMIRDEDSKYYQGQKGE